MMLQDEETLEMKETFSSMQHEVELKTKKLKRVKMTHLLMHADAR